MTEKVVAGIHEENLNTLALEVIDYADQISGLFSQISACVEKLPDALQGPSGKTLMDRYQALKSSYPTIKDNIISYSEDFTTLIQKMKEDDKYLANLADQFAADTKTQIKTSQFNFKQES
ncbi:hypothetical protein IKD82_01800 [Candidatus Saccharibacteria bacterium]|nr:hypothetical protein [Candidatus Saccharibacteria bacterium]